MAHPRAVVALAAAMALSGACGSSPTGPAPDPAGGTAIQAGAWKGVWQTTSCVGPCSSAPELFSLRVAEGGAGVLQFGVDVATDAVPLTVDVSAARTAAGTTVTGASAVPSLSQARSVEVRLDLTEAGDSLAGSFRYTMSGNAPFTKEGRVLVASRDTAIYGARFQGRWAGWVTRTQCSGSCNIFDSVIGSGGVSLLIAQNGQAASARLNFFEFAGTATGVSITLAGREEVPPGGCVPGSGSGVDPDRLCVRDVTLSATVDALDRLRGTISYRVEGIDGFRRAYAYDAVADLTHVARWQ